MLLTMPSFKINDTTIARLNKFIDEKWNSPASIKNYFTDLNQASQNVDRLQNTIAKVNTLSVFLLGSTALAFSIHHLLTRMIAPRSFQRPFRFISGVVSLCLAIYFTWMFQNTIVNSKSQQLDLAKKILTQFRDEITFFKSFSAKLKNNQLEGVIFLFNKLSHTVKARTDVDTAKKKILALSSWIWNSSHNF